jgi:hypothetical protein
MKRIVFLGAVVALAMTASCSASSSTETTGSSRTAAVLAPDPDLDPKTHARLHVVALDPAGGNVDVFVDGVIANNGGQDQVDVPAGYVTAYLYLAPGKHA